MSRPQLPEIVYCPYCDLPAPLARGQSIYPHRPDLFEKYFYLCTPCDAYVGVHPGTLKPLGRLADAELRRWKQRTHAAFDPIWMRRFLRKRKLDANYTKAMARGGRYKHLSRMLGIPMRECHIGMFDIDRCRQALEIMESGALERAETTV